MAIRSLKGEELKDFQSANAYRLELNSIDTECLALEWLVDAESEVDGIVDEQMLQTLRGNSTANKIVGMALMVASTAAEASYNKALLDAQHSLNKSNKEKIQRAIIDSANGDYQTLTQLIEQTEAARKNLESTQQSYYVEYQDTRLEAQRAMENAKRNYEKEIQELRKDLDRFDSDHKKELALMQSDLEQLTKKREEGVKSFEVAMNEAQKEADRQYEAEEKRIRSELSGADADKALREATLLRDEQKKRAMKLYEINVQKLVTESHRQKTILEQQLAEFIQRRNAERKSMFHDRIADAQTRRDAIINRQNDVIKASQIRYKKEAKAAKSKNTNAQVKLEQYQSQSNSFGKAYLLQGEKYALTNGTAEEKKLFQRVNADREAAKIAADSGQQHIPLATEADYKMAEQIAVKYASEILLGNIAVAPIASDPSRIQVTSEVGGIQSASDGGKYNIESNNRILGSGAVNFIKTVERNHINIGESLVMMFGSPEEVHVLTAVNADIKAKVDAHNEGRLYLSMASPSDYKRADQIVSRYAGNISSESGIKKTLEFYAKTSRMLIKERDAIKNNIAAKTNEAKQLDGQIQALQQKVNQIAADKLAIKTGKDSAGNKLTQAQMASIAKRVQSESTAAEKAKMLAELKTRHNVLNSDLENMQEKLRKTKALIGSIQVHAGSLQRHGEVVASVIKNNKNAGLTFASAKKMSLEAELNNRIRMKANSTMASDNKKANRMISKRLDSDDKNSEILQSKGVGIILKSTEKIQRGAEVNFSRVNAAYNTNTSHSDADRNNASHGHLSGVAHDESQPDERYGMALNAGKFGMSTINIPAGLMATAGGVTFRKIGESTAVGRILAGNKMAKNMSGGGRVLSDGANNTLMASAKTQGISANPTKLMKLPQTVVKKVADGTLRFTRNVVGGATVAAVGSKFNKARARRMARKAMAEEAVADQLDLTKSRIASVAQNRPLSKLANAAKEIAGKFMGVVGGLFTSAIGAITSMFMTLCGGGMIFLILSIVIAVVISMIYSAYSATQNFDNKVDTEDALVQNYPQYVLVQAANYRNTELDIYELFNLASLDNSQGRIKIKANENPVYYALYDDKSDAFKSPEWTSAETLNPINQSALEVFKKLEDHCLGNVTTANFQGKVKYYDNVKLSYYYSDQVTQDANGNYQYDGEPSEYEISNAKDALAMVDTLYTVRQENMQRLEVLAYLGVGDYQLGYTDSGKAVTNLFWASHNLIYNSGTKDEDVWFHETNSYATNTDDTSTYSINSYLRLNSDGTTRNELVVNSNTTSCDNKREISFSIDDQVEIEQEPHLTLTDYQKDINSTNRNPYGEYTVPESAYSTAKESGDLTPTEIYYYYGSKTDPVVKLADGSQINCYLTTETVEVDVTSFLNVGSDFTPRLEAPSPREDYWTSKFGYGGYSPHPVLNGRFAGDVLPNCTAWAYGRFYELLGEEPLLNWNNAEYWFISDRGGIVYERGQEPRVGAVLCWSMGAIGDDPNMNGTDPGHVAIVEQVLDDGSIITSESGYGNFDNYWWTTRRDRNGRWDANGNYLYYGPNSWGGGYTYKFQGFIYCPTVSTNTINDNCKTLRFYSPSGNGTFYVVDKADNYMGQFTISSSCNSAAYNAMTKNKTINTTDGYLNLKYFELDWNSEKECYEAEIAYWTGRAGQEKYTNTEAVVDCPTPMIDVSKIIVKCKHGNDTTTTMENVVIQVCLGHADLDASMVVSLIDGGLGHEAANNQLFEDATKVVGLESNTSTVNLKGLAVSNELDLAGWEVGDEFEYISFSPADDWGEGSEYRNVARAKMSANIKTTVPENMTIDQLLSYNGSDESYVVRHYGGLDVDISMGAPETTEPEDTDPPETEPVDDDPVYFSNEIKMNYLGYNTSDGKYIPYYMFKPSVKSDYDIPLIVWLHGSGERGVWQGSFEASGIMPVLKNWNSAGVNAYIVCPQLQWGGTYASDTWCLDSRANNIKALIDYLVKIYNVDTNRIYLVGHSLGGEGVMYMASKLPGYFAACASLSPYNCGINPYTYDSEIITIAGDVGYGEAQGCIIASNYYANIIGKENVYFTKSSHGNLPKIVFTADDDHNGKADIMEWFFKHARDGDGNIKVNDKVQIDDQVQIESTKITKIPFSPLEKSADGVLLYGMMIYGKTYYVESYISGAQENIPVYEIDDSSGELVGPSALSILAD